jgi:hypothetical protein
MVEVNHYAKMWVSSIMVFGLVLVVDNWGMWDIKGKRVQGKKS